MVQKPVLNNVKKGTGQREVRPVWTNAMRVNNQKFSNSRRNFAPTAVLTKSGLVPLSTARQSFSRTTTPVSAARGGWKKQKMHEWSMTNFKEAKDSEVCKITRKDGSSSFHGDIQALLRRLDRQDLRQLYSLVQERFKDHPLEGHDLDQWGDLRMLFDLNKEDDIWLNQQYWELLRWKLHEYSGVHSLFLDGTSIQINMLVEKKYPLKKEILEKMINLKIEAEEERKEAKVFERILSKSKSFNSKNLRFEVFDNITVNTSWKYVFPKDCHRRQNSKNLGRPGLRHCRRYQELQFGEPDEAMPEGDPFNQGIAKVELVFCGVGFNGKVIFLSEVAEAEVERMDE
ncbi:hypothetical protein Tco_0544931 [Tanacetum coccineum]